MVEQAAEVAAEEQAETASEGEKPAEEQDINKLRSVLDRQIATEKRRADDAEAETTRLKQLATETEQQLAILKENVSADVQEQTKALAEARTRVAADRAEVDRLARDQVIDGLTVRYGAPKDLLEKETDPIRMENAALRWEREQRTSSKGEEPVPKTAAERMAMATVAHAPGSQSDQELVNRLGRGEALTATEMLTASKAMDEKGLLPKAEE